MEPVISPVVVKKDFFTPLTKVTTFSKYVALVLVIALPFIGGWVGYNYAPVKIIEVERVIAPSQETEENINSTDLTVTSAKVVDGVVEVLLSDGQQKVIARSVGWSDTDNPELLETYIDASISPNKKFVAIGGFGFEDAIVRIYCLVDDQLENRIYGSVTNWTDDGKIEIKSCDLSGESCAQYISSSSEMPWVLVEVGL